jgi:hypothetical protein
MSRWLPRTRSARTTRRRWRRSTGSRRKQPGKPLAPNLRGRVLTLKGDFDGARKSFEEALARDPTNFAATDALAALDLRENKPGRRRAALRQAAGRSV